MYDDDDDDDDDEEEDEDDVYTCYPFVNQSDIRALIERAHRPACRIKTLDVF